MGIVIFIIISGLFIIGSSSASFVQLALYRHKTNQSILYPSRSYCESCHTPIKIFFLIPVIGYLLSHGQCKCGYKVPIKYPLTEFITGTLFTLIVLIVLVFLVI